jgi:hypothetical protein
MLRSSRLGMDGKIRNLPFKPGYGGEPFPLPGEEESAHEITLEVAQKFADLETTIKSALTRLPGKKPVLLGALKKAKSGLTQWARGIEAREERLMRRQLEASKLPPREINQLMQQWRSQRKINHWEDDRAAFGASGNVPGSPTDETANDRFWLTPPEIYAALSNRYGPFDFDPCPCPRPDGYNSLAIPWGTHNYVNPPFHQHDGVDGQGPTAFVRKAIAEQKMGKTSVLTLPVQSYVNLLLEPGRSKRAKCPLGGCQSGVKLMR